MNKTQRELQLDSTPKNQASSLAPLTLSLDPLFSGLLDHNLISHCPQWTTRAFGRERGKRSREDSSRPRALQPVNKQTNKQWPSNIVRVIRQRPVTCVFSQNQGTQGPYTHFKLIEPFDVCSQGKGRTKGGNGPGIPSKSVAIVFYETLLCSNEKIKV